MRTDEYVQEKVQEIEACPSERGKKEKRTEYGVTEKGGAFDKLKYFSGNNKTPVEILHTILLGPVKYLLKMTIQSLNQQQKEQVHAKVASLDMSAFPAKIRGNITRNYGSYVGRDFKLWMQVAVFVLQDIIPDEQLIVWELLSEIFSFAYASGFDKRNKDAANQMLTTFLETIKNTFPELLKKQKIHLLLHLVDDIENLGPANGFCTERFEAFNSVIRGMNVHSNRHASSLDICTKIAKMERLRFVLSGGKWGENHGLQASEQLKQLAEDPKIQHFLNNTPTKMTMQDKLIHQPGCLRKGTYEKGKLTSNPLKQCLSPMLIEEIGLDGEGLCTVHKAVVSENSTLINSGTPIVYVDNSLQHHIGIFKKGIKMESTGESMVEIERVELIKNESQQVMGSFQCPKVKRTDQTNVIPPVNVIDQICLVHDCTGGNCSFTEADVTTTIKREDVTKVKYSYVHNLNHAYYLVNKFYLGESLKFFDFV